MSFSYKQDGSKAECLGFIAEDCPSEVTSAEHDAIVVNHIVAALTKVVKDQQRVIDTLESRLRQLEARAGLAGTTSVDDASTVTFGCRTIEVAPPW